jgi:adenosine deaminase
VGAEGSDFKFVKHPSLKFLHAFVCAAMAAFTAGAQSPSKASIAKPPGASAVEERTAKYLPSVRERPLELMGFLDRMPKGGDLHNHLTGAVYAESYINYAVEDGDCIDRATFKILQPPCDAARGLMPASQAISDFVFRNLVIDALSIRNFHPTAEDRDVRLHFFATFGKFDLVTNKHWGEMLAEVTHRAGAQNEVYLETMLTPDQGEAIQLGKQVSWNDDFGAMRSQMLAGGMSKVVADGRKNLDDAETKMRQVLGCDAAQPDVGCRVTLRYLNQVLRAFPKEQVFAQMVAGFEIASADPRVVGINLVQSQDEFNALHDFDLQMRMLDYLHGVYPKVHITLHAGELTPGEVKPEELYASHIRKSIEMGHAERIGHGLDVIYEQDPVGLVALMARKHILVEDCLYSHELVRDMKGSENVLPTYLRGGVPVSLATDDEAIVRSELTWYFRRAVEGYNVDYHTLKRMVRDSLEHAFLAGASLWVAPEDFRMVAACANEKVSDKPAGAPCREFLAGSEKARLQWKEENEFARFESKF